MTTNTVAAVIPLYNKEPFVARAISSILMQTQAVDEIIVVDDASTDGSVERVEAFSDPRMRILRRTDPRERGLPASRNCGILAAQSRWIALLDADDRWHRHFIEEAHRLMACATDSVGFLFTGWETIARDGTTTQDLYSRRNVGGAFTRLDLEGFVGEWLASGACPVFPSGVVIRRDVLVEA